MKLKHIIILQNKIDLLQESVAINQHESFRPGAEVEEIKGAVAGGSILRVSFLPEADSVSAVSAHYKLSVLGEVGELPDVFVELEVIPHPRTQNLSPFYLPMSLYGHISNNGSYAKLPSFFDISDLNS
ncbi:unnamed protein product [Sphagnum tenellum]